MVQKTPLSRKDIKEPDEFLTLSRRAAAWAGGHQRWVVRGGLLAAAVLVLIGVTAAYWRAQQRDANADLTRAMAKLGADDPAGAQLALNEVANRWSGTTVGALAALLAADSAVRAAQADEALALTGRIPLDQLPPYLRQQALMTAGAALESKQRWDEAAARYQEAAGLSGPYTGRAIVSEARSRELAGQADKARELYRQAYEQFPDLPDRDLLPPKFRS